VVVYPSPDGKYRFLVVYENYFDLSQYLPYYLLILAAVALLCWILATNLASPLRGLARVVDRFGAGDLSVRVNSSRKDEIGEVARAFDRMAERIGTLLTAERRLLQDISHELRSPLARLSFAAELARTAGDRDAAIARMNKEIARLTDLVGGLIQVTRAEGDPAANSSESLRLDQLLGEVIDDCQVEAEARGCRIAFAGTAELTMHGDREILRRAIENVIRNAIRYTPAATSVDVQLDTNADAARIAVRDYGPGVPPDALPKIFQPFFRVDDSRYTATGGVGLGLAIASRAIGLHHGKLWAENTHPGLRVWIELPLVG
jgi:two-component system sensor histidine kinase CpxA